MHAVFQDGQASLSVVCDLWRAYEATVEAKLPSILRSAEILIEAG